jgi:hypothetical protein
MPKILLDTTLFVEREVLHALTKQTLLETVGESRGSTSVNPSASLLVG